MRPSGNSLRLTTTAAVLLVFCVGGILAQTSRDRRDAPTEKQLQQRAVKAEETLLKELQDVAAEYQRQGQPEKALEVMQRMETISPAAPGLRERIRQLQEELLQSNGLDVEVVASGGWSSQPVAEVTGGRPFRIQAAGEYKLTFSATLPVTGLPTKDPTRDYIADAAFGALIGVLFSDGKPGAPFSIGASAEMTPKMPGLLFLRVNIPATARGSGTLRVHLSGGIRAPVRGQGVRNTPASD